jgi:imidazole glycerol-phosphate synthase subunit HisH
LKITIVDYGMGNLHSILSTLNYLGFWDINISAKRDDLVASDRLILPGVGNFNLAMQIIKEKKLDISLSESVLEKEIPILGICLGMQLLGVSSTESKYTTGLSFIKNKCEVFNSRDLTVPHVGFNQVNINPNSILLKNLNPCPDFYFTHSFQMLPLDDAEESLTTYGNSFVSAFEKGNIFGTQFHPELSQKNGMIVFKNFLEFNA